MLTNATIYVKIIQNCRIYVIMIRRYGKIYSKTVLLKCMVNKKTQKNT